MSDLAKRPYGAAFRTYLSTDDHDCWQLLFADPDCGNQWFGGEDYTPEQTKALALEAWERYAPAWSIRLMRTVTYAELAEAEQLRAERCPDALRGLLFFAATNGTAIEVSAEQVNLYARAMGWASRRSEGNSDEG